MNSTQGVPHHLFYSQSQHLGLMLPLPSTNKGDQIVGKRISSQLTPKEGIPLQPYVQNYITPQLDVLRFHQKLKSTRPPLPVSTGDRARKVTNPSVIVPIQHTPYQMIARQSISTKQTNKEFQAFQKQVFGMQRQAPVDAADKENVNENKPIEGGLSLVGTHHQVKRRLQSAGAYTKIMTGQDRGGVMRNEKNAQAMLFQRSSSNRGCEESTQRVIHNALIARSSFISSGKQEEDESASRVGTYKRMGSALSRQRPNMLPAQSALLKSQESFGIKDCARPQIIRVPQPEERRTSMMAMSVNLESDQPDQAIAQKRKPLVRPYSSKPIIKKSASEKDLVIDLKSRRTSVQRYDSNENKTPFPKPGITAKSWIIYDVEKQEVFQSKKDSIKRQVASLTKIMTFYTCLKLIDKYGVNPYQTKITVSKIASSINGTSAQLKKGICRDGILSRGPNCETRSMLLQWQRQTQSYGNLMMCKHYFYPCSTLLGCRSFPIKRQPDMSGNICDTCEY